MQIVTTEEIIRRYFDAIHGGAWEKSLSRTRGTILRYHNYGGNSAAAHRKGEGCRSCTLSGSFSRGRKRSVRCRRVSHCARREDRLIGDLFRYRGTCRAHEPVAGTEKTAQMPSEAGLSERLHAALTDEPTLRQVKMFGGVSFMVNGKLAAGVTREGDLLLRCDPVETDLLLARRGVRSPLLDRDRARVQPEKSRPFAPELITFCP